MTLAARGAERGHLRRGRAGFDALEIRLAASRLDARRALAVARMLGAARGFLSGRWPAAREVAALFGTGPLASRRIALRIASREACHRLVIRRCEGRPLAPFAPVVRWRDPAAAAALAPPRILITAHIGALHLLPLAMDTLARPRTVLRWSQIHEPADGERNAHVEGGLGRRAQALLDAAAELRAGGFVSTTVDGGFGAARPVEVLGRKLDLGMGGFALAGWTGAGIVPVAALWEGTEVVCELGDPLSGPSEAARWLEDLLRRRPGQISLGLMRHLLFGPAVGAAAEDPAALELPGRE